MGRPTKQAPNHGKYYEVKKVITDANGNKSRKSFYSTVSKADAARQAMEYQAKVALKKEELIRVGFSEFADQWLELCKSNSVADNTYNYTYRNSVENHLKKYFGGYTLNNIRLEDVQKFFNSKADCSESLLNKLKITLNAIFENAIDRDLLYKNPCKGLVMPQSKKIPKKMQCYTAEQARKIVDYVKSTDPSESIMILLKAGLRRGELLGLRWDDVDLDNNIIHVRQAVSETRGVLQVGLPKTPMSVRDIPIDQEASDFLRVLPRQVTRYKGKRKERTSYIVQNVYVVAGENGGAMYPSHWQKRVYKPFMDRMSASLKDVPPLNAHELRHTYGTLLYKSGTDIYTIQKLMGHASIEITTGIYIENDITTIKNSIKLDW